MIKNIVFYFSGTGNSLAVAQSIEEALPDTRAIPILSKDALRFTNTEAERVGFVFPIYMNAVPKVVVQFIESLKPVPSTYYFAVATHGGIPGMAGLYLNKVLKKQRIALDAYYEIKMINNTPKGVAPKFLMSLNWELDITPEKVGLALKEANGAISASIDGIVKKEKTTLQNIPKGLRRLSYWLMNVVWSISNYTKHKLDFVLDGDTCIGCGTCSDICPTKRIAVQDLKPYWINDKCYFCYACFNYCPSQAIGVEHYIKKQGRYHHPEYSAGTISEQWKGIGYE